MKIIFLDINGVLNSIKSRSKAYEISNDRDSLIRNSFDDNCMLVLKKLVLDTNSYIVVTSTWRKNREYYTIFLEVFKKYLPIERIIGTTRIDSYEKRILEIKEYLTTCSYKISKFVILDDNNQMDDLIDHFVHIDSRYGLSDIDYENAFKILGK